ncbi:TonB-dependent receptor [Thiomicrorhabdus sp. 6S2-11]|uniref:TonB-dependent receptor n=1 Tax=Thiomicrorhabdus marina TaxID=2818442 RepID=A0ABS3Q7V5_9GAMM|nr:TonB-dependent receptor [Thiomicrorhabdus marina]MBO1928423.1 TonB-dependent receptor [Thiomicrorhabdus marina]
MLRKKTLFIALFPLLSGPSIAAETLQTIEVEAPADSNDAQVQSQTTEQLKQQASGDTLGDYLQSQANVDSASYGPAVGRPVVRGMSGYRVKILQNDAEVNDLSAMSQDHAVGVMPKAAERIELLKGPASIVYGASAGGTVRLVEASQHQFPVQGVAAQIEAEAGSNNNLQSFGAEASATSETFTFGVSGNRIQTDDYTDGDGNQVQNSDVLTEQAKLFAGWRYQPNAQLIFSYAQLHKDYGIPNSTTEATRIDMQRDSYSLHWSETEPLALLDELSFDLSYSDYLHDETEGGRKDGLFGQKTLQATLSAEYYVDDWLGQIQFAYRANELKVCHEHGACEDFSTASRSGIEANVGTSLENYYDSTGLPYSHGHPMPDTDAQTWMFGINAEKPLSNKAVYLSLGAHIEVRQLNADPSNIQETWVVPQRLDADYYQAETDFAGSLSVGLKHPIGKRLQSQVNLSYLERLPSADELYWNGFHHATDSYIFGNRDLKKERSVNLDWDLLMASEKSDWTLSSYAYYFWNYIYQDPVYDSNGDAVLDPFHLSDVWQTLQTDAIFAGASLRNDWRVADYQQQPIVWSNQFEAGLAQQTNGENLPRTAPYSYLTELSYRAHRWSARLSVKHVFAAKALAENEQVTDAYTWASAYVDWQPKTQYGDWKIWLKAENVLDDYAQITSLS